MVADTNKTKMTDMFETMTQNAHNAMDVGRRMQDCMFSTMTNLGHGNGDQNDSAGEQTQFAKSWFSLVCDNMQRFGEASLSCFQSGLDVTKVACDVAKNMGQDDVYAGQRKVMDSAFQAMQHNMDTMNKAGKSATDSWVSLSQSGTCCEAGTTKNKVKDAK